MSETIPDYDELKLRIEPGEGGRYRVLAFCPDDSTVSGTFVTPFTETELDNFVLRVGLPRRSVRSFHSSQMEEAKRFGSKLLEALLQGETRDAYRGARRLADSHERGLRVTLYLTDVPELMEIPWEFLYERPSFLSQSIYTPLVRSLDLKNVRPPRKVTLPLRILAMVSSPEGFPGLDVERERQKLEQALGSLRAEGMVELDWLDRATMGELDRYIGAPEDTHVFHYIGHGAYDERTQGGILLLENARGGPQEVSGEELSSLLSDERSLRLAVLNSCEGARTSHIDPFSGVASSLVECGIPAVIGMQFEITDEAAITFSERLYTALAQGYPVDAALAQARKAIFAEGNDIEFGTPVLFLRGADARLFDVEPAPAPADSRGEPPPVTAEPNLALDLRQHPSEATPGDRITWELTIENTGSSALDDVVARQADGNAIADPVGLAVGRRSVIRWTENAEPGLRELITVTASDSRGSRVSEQVIAEPTIAKSPWPGKKASLIAAGLLVIAAAAGALLLTRKPDDGNNHGSGHVTPKPPTGNKPAGVAKPAAYKSYTPRSGGYRAALPAGADWSRQPERVINGAIYRTVADGPGGLSVLIDYTPGEPAVFKPDDSCHVTTHPSFPQSKKCVFSGGKFPQCSASTCVDYLLNASDNGPGYGILVGGGDLAKVETIARRVMRSLRPKEPA